jgi:hypothetical protein
MTEKLKRSIVQPSRWNQEIAGATLAQNVISETQWLCAGWGHQLLARGLEGIDDQLIKRVRLMVGQFGSSDKCRQLPLGACVDLTHLSARDGNVGLVNCNMVVEHLYELASMLQELARVISRESLFILQTTNTNSCVVCGGHLGKPVFPRAWIVRLIRWSERRESGDIPPTRYRAKTRSKLQNLLGDAALKEQSCELLLGPRPLLCTFVPLDAFELLSQRLISLGPSDFLCTTIPAVYQESGSPEVRSTYTAPASYTAPTSYESAGAKIERSRE